MKTSWGIFTAALIALTALLLSPLTRDVPEIAQLQGALGIDTNPLPDFAQYNDVRQKKQAFFGYLQPMVSANNQRLLQERRRLLAIAATPSDQRGYADQRLVEGLEKYYEVDAGIAAEAQLKELLLRVDIVPASLALSQAAMESAWGTSRFALEGNN